MNRQTWASRLDAVLIFVFLPDRHFSTSKVLKVPKSMPKCTPKSTKMRTKCIPRHPLLLYLFWVRFLIKNELQNEAQNATRAPLGGAWGSHGTPKMPPCRFGLHFEAQHGPKMTKMSIKMCQNDPQNDPQHSIVWALAPRALALSWPWRLQRRRF